MKLTNKFIIVIPAWNAGHLIDECLYSIYNQTYDDIGIIIRDDISTDDTREKVKQLIQGRSDIIFIENTSKFYPVGNVYDSVMNYVDNDDAIVGVVDGDDSLNVNYAVERIMQEYEKNKNLWLVWSQHQTSTGHHGFSNPLPPDEHIKKSRNYWSVSHFRTNHIKLFHHLNIDDLKDPFTNDGWSPYCGDACYLFPFCEMSLNEHSKFINEPLYYYNNNLPTNEHNKDRNNAIAYGQRIRSKKIYKGLESL